MRCPPLWARVLFGAGIAAVALPAWGHTTQGVGDFHAGFLHPITAPEHVIAFLALGILASQRGHTGLRTVIIFVIAATIGACAALSLPLHPVVDLVNIASIIILGALVASNWACPQTFLYPLAAITGLSHGLANGSAVAAPIKSYLFIPGFVVAILLVVGIGLAASDWLLQKRIGWMQIAIRAAGSWIAAIGILVLAASWKTLVP